MTVVTTSRPLWVMSRSSVLFSSSKSVAATRSNALAGRGVGKREKMRLVMSTAAAARIEDGSLRASFMVETSAGRASSRSADCTTAEGEAESAAKMSETDDPSRGSEQGRVSLSSNETSCRMRTFRFFEPCLEDGTDEAGARRSV